MKILLAVDDSKHSQAATQAVAAQFAAPGNEVQVLHIVEPLILTPYFDGGEFYTRQLEGLEKEEYRRGKELVEQTPEGTVSYTYDAASRRTSMKVAGQPAVNYSYDAANRLLQIAQGTGVVSFAYDGASRRTSLTLPSGIVESYSYDAGSELTGINYQLAGNALGNLAYNYDLAGRRTSVGGSFARTGIPLPVSTTAYNAANELTQWGTATLTYDASGNMLSDGTNSFVWDARNHLASMNAGIDSFQYGPLGRRVAKTISGAATNYLYDGVNPVQELSGGAPTANMLTGLRVDEDFLRTDSSGPANFLTDPLGSTVALADSTGVIQTSYTYEPFGNTAIAGSSTSPYQYPGRENDATGLYYYRARYYWPVAQRFVAQDPVGFLGGDVNLYGYVRNSPLTFRDPAGQDPVIGAGVGLIAGAISGATGAALSCGSRSDIILGAVVGAVVGGGLGLVDPTLGLGTLALINGAGAGLGDLSAQLIPQLPSILAGRKPHLNAGSTIGAAVGGALGTLVGGPVTEEFAGAGAPELVSTIRGVGAGAVPGTLIGAFGARLGDPACGGVH